MFESLKPIPFKCHMCVYVFVWSLDSSLCVWLSDWEPKKTVDRAVYKRKGETTTFPEFLLERMLQTFLPNAFKPSLSLNVVVSSFFLKLSWLTFSDDLSGLGVADALEGDDDFDGSAIEISNSDANL